MQNKSNLAFLKVVCLWKLGLSVWHFWQFLISFEANFRASDYCCWLYEHLLCKPRDEFKMSTVCFNHHSQQWRANRD